MKTAICTLIKNEHSYLDEWLSYHLNIGIDEIYLYEDYGSLSHASICSKYNGKVHLNLLDSILGEKKDFSSENISKGSFFQEKLFNWFPKEYKDKLDWVLFIDVDEFLILKEPLHQLLYEYKDTSIYIKWVFYNANGHIKKPIGKVMDNFTQTIPTSFDYFVNYKSFVNLKKYTHWKQCIHGVNDGVFPLNEYGDNKAYINHYFTKSWEEWKWKILSRGDTSPGHRKINEFFILNSDLEPMKEQLISEISS